MKTTSFFSLSVMASSVAVFSALLAVLVSPTLFVRDLFVGTGGKLVVTVALLAMMLSAPVVHLVRARFFCHPLSRIELVSASAFSLATPFLFLASFRRLAIAITTVELSSSFTSYVLIIGLTCTLLGAVSSAILFARYAQ